MITSKRVLCSQSRCKHSVCKPSCFSGLGCLFAIWDSGLTPSGKAYLPCNKGFKFLVLVCHQESREGELIVLAHTGLISSLRRRKVNKHLMQSRSANISLSPGEEPCSPTTCKEHEGLLLLVSRCISLRASHLCLCPHQLPYSDNTLSLPPPWKLQHNTEMKTGVEGCKSSTRCSRPSHGSPGRPPRNWHSPMEDRGPNNVV